MIYNMKKMNLFEVDHEYSLAHCISSDLKMGAGIAVQFNQRYDIKNKLIQRKSEGENTAHPSLMVETINDNQVVFNLITKEKYHHKPTFADLVQSVVLMKKYALYFNIKKIAMPKIGCGLDRLHWNDVEQAILEIFKDTDIEILICYI